MSLCNIPLPLLDLILSHLNIAEVLALAYTCHEYRDIIFQQVRIERYLSCNYPYLDFDANILVRDHNRVCKRAKDAPWPIINRRWKKSMPLPWAKILHTLHLTTNTAQLGLNSFIPYTTKMLDGLKCYRYINLLRSSLVNRKKKVLYLDLPVYIWLSQTHTINDIIVHLTQVSDFCSALKDDDYMVTSFRLSEFIDTQEFEKQINDILLHPLDEGYGLVPDHWAELPLSEWLAFDNPLFVIQKM